MNPESFSDDVREFLADLFDHKVRYLIVGGEAVVYYGYPRLTGDVDIYYNSSPENVDRLWDVLNVFWDNDIPGIQEKSELLETGVVFQFGVPPNRIDLLNSIDQVSFSAAWDNRVTEKITVADGEIHVYYIGIDDLIRNKKSLSRNKDMDDLRFLEKRRGS